jgi:sigma-B regulation protein RsbU (phosphoserine phosphatase)
MQDAYSRLACFELWGGNCAAEFPVELPGLRGWVQSTPLEPGSGGGDVHYMSVCSRGRLSRIALADVSGHGASASGVAEGLRETFRRHTNNWDQSALMRELSVAFLKGSVRTQFATAAVLGFYVETSELLFTNAGHPPPLWFHAEDNSWDWMQDGTSYAREVEDLPLGLIPETSYSQTAVQIGPSDLLLLYTDGITESRNEAGIELGREGLLRIAHGLHVGSPMEFGRGLLLEVEAFRGSAPRRDDETLVVLQRTASPSGEHGLP